LVLILQILSTLFPLLSSAEDGLC